MIPGWSAVFYSALLLSVHTVAVYAGLGNVSLIIL